MWMRRGEGEEDGGEGRQEIRKVEKVDEKIGDRNKAGRRERGLRNRR